MHKTFWKQLAVMIVGYLIYAYLIASNWGTFKYLSIFVLLGAFITYFLLGAWTAKAHFDVTAVLGIVLPYGLATTFYYMGLAEKSETYIRLFRALTPQVYGSTDFLEPFIPVTMLPSNKYLILTVIIIPLAYASYWLGGYCKRSEKSAVKWLYNNLLVWGIHYFLFVALTNIMTSYPKILTDERARILFAFIGTVILFGAYFLAGRICRTLPGKVGQITSVLSVTVTSVILYIGMLFLVVEGGVFERYMLPVATSFFGILCRQIGLWTGATAKVISQYGFIATLIMILIPTVMIVVGKYASLSDEE